MTRSAPFLAAIAIGTLARHDADACSCSGPHLTFLSPSGDATPTNARVRIEAPTHAFQLSTLVLRAHNGPTVVTTARSYPGSMVTIVELVPTVALQPDTRFEVATIDPNAHPPTTVIGTFKTGTSTDTTAPRLDSFKQHTRLNTQFGGGSCSIRGPWIELTDMVVSDDRTTKLAYAVWSANAAGAIDTTRQPDTLLFAYQEEKSINIGQTSSCDPRTFPLTGSAVSLAIAAIDDAGNTSRVLRLRADLTHATP